MQATIKIYEKRKQTRKDEQGVPHTSIAMRTIDTLTYTVADELPIGKKLARLNHFAANAIGARYKAILGAGKKLGSKIFFAIAIDGKVYSSESSMLRANMTNLVTVSRKDVADKDGNPLDGKVIIANVASIQTVAIKQSISYLADLARIAKEADTFEGEAVKAGAMLVGIEGDIVSEV